MVKVAVQPGVPRNMTRKAETAADSPEKIERNVRWRRPGVDLATRIVFDEVQIEQSTAALTVRLARPADDLDAVAPLERLVWGGVLPVVEGERRDRPVGEVASRSRVTTASQRGQVYRTATIPDGGAGRI
jgi:hypothetical protein